MLNKERREKKRSVALRLSADALCYGPAIPALRPPLRPLKRGYDFFFMLCGQNVIKLFERFTLKISVY